MAGSSFTGAEAAGYLLLPVGLLVFSNLLSVTFHLLGPPGLGLLWVIFLFKGPLGRGAHWSGQWTSELVRAKVTRDHSEKLKGIHCFVPPACSFVRFANPVNCPVSGKPPSHLRMRQMFLGNYGAPPLYANPFNALLKRLQKFY